MTTRKKYLFITLFFIILLFLFFSNRSSSTHKMLGIYDPKKTVRPSFELKKYYNNVAIVAKRYDWEKRFPKRFVYDTINQHSIPFLFWEPTEWYDRDLFELATITDGIWDEHIRSWAKDTKEYEYPVYLCIAPFPELKESPWGKKQGDDWIETYKATLKHIKTIFDEENAFNVIWVWGITNEYVITNSFDKLTKLYPGDEYVDSILFSSIPILPEYRWNDTSLDTLFKEGIDYISKIHPESPLFIAGIPLQTHSQQEELLKALTSSLNSIDGILLNIDTITENTTAIVSNPLFKFDTEQLVLKKEKTSPKSFNIAQGGKVKRYPEHITQTDIVKGSEFIRGTQSQEKATISLYQTQNSIHIDATITDSTQPITANYTEERLENSDAFIITFEAKQHKVQYGINLRDSEPKIWNYTTFKNIDSVSVEINPNMLILSMDVPLPLFKIEKISIRITDQNEKNEKIIYKTTWKEVIYE